MPAQAVSSVHDTRMSEVTLDSAMFIPVTDSLDRQLEDAARGVVTDDTVDLTALTDYITHISLTHDTDTSLTSNPETRSPGQDKLTSASNPETKSVGQGNDNDLSRRPTEGQVLESKIYIELKREVTNTIPHGGVVLEGLLPLENNNSEISAVIKEEVSRWEKSSHVGADTEIDESSMPSLPLSDFYTDSPDSMVVLDFESNPMMSADIADVSS